MFMAINNVATVSGYHIVQSFDGEVLTDWLHSIENIDG